MNRINNNNNNIIKENELKINKFFAPRNTLHYDWLKEFLGEKYNVVYEAAESWDADNFNHHREAGKYNSENGGEITYKYEHHINKNGDYHMEWGKSWKDPSRIWSESIKVRPNNLKSLEPNFGSLESNEVIKHRERLNRYQNDKKDFEGKLSYYESLSAEEKKNKDIFSLKEKIACLDKEIKNEEDWISKNVNDLLIDKDPGDNQSELIKENQDLRKQLAEVKQEIVRVSEELKKLKDNLTDEDKEKFAKEFIEVQEQNDKLVSNPNASVAEIKEHTVKVEDLGKKVNARNVNTETFSTNSPDGKDNSNLLIGGGIALISILTFGLFSYYLVKKKKNK